MRRQQFWQQMEVFLPGCVGPMLAEIFRPQAAGMPQDAGTVRKPRVQSQGIGM